MMSDRRQSVEFFAEAVDDRVDVLQFLLEFTDSRLVRVVAATDLVALTFGALVGFGQLADLTLDRVEAATHRLCLGFNASLLLP